MSLFVIADDNETHCIKAATYINNIHNCKVIATINDGHKLLHYLHNEKILPDIVLLDVEMQGLNGVITAEYINTFFPSIKIIAFTSHTGNNILNDMFAAGAKAFIWKYKFEDETYLKKAIEEIQLNNFYWDNRLTDYSANELNTAVENRKKEIEELRIEHKLTKKQEQVILLNAARTDFDYISSILHTSKRTIGNTVNALVQKLNAGAGRDGLFDFSITHGFIKLPHFNRGGGKI